MVVKIKKEDCKLEEEDCEGTGYINLLVNGYRILHIEMDSGEIFLDMRSVSAVGCRMENIYG